MDGAVALHRCEHFSLEVCWCSVCARVDGALGVCTDAGTLGFGIGGPHQCKSHLLRGLLRVCDVLAAVETAFPKSVCGRPGVMAGECIGAVSPPWKRSAGVSIAARMDFRKFSATSLALDVCQRAAIPTKAIVRIILAVFGIAIALVLLWLFLWIRAMKEKS